MNEKAKQIAERAANRLSGNVNDDFTLRLSIEKINERLSHIESKFNLQTPHATIRSLRAEHPSEEKFNVAEAVVEELVSFFEQEKTCMFEPDKSCDKCSMCSSRGF